MSMDPIGHVDFLTAKRDAALSMVRSPRDRARILGVPFRLPPAKEHRISVDLKTGAREAEEVISSTAVAIPLPPRPARVPRIDQDMTLAQRIAQARQIQLQRKLGVDPDLCLRTDAIIEAVADAYGITTHAIVSAGRHHKVAHPRMAAMKIMRDHKAMSTSRIGHALGKRDHTTVMYGLLRADEFYETLSWWRTRYDHALTALGKQP